ncbi:MAG TPA: glucose-6-phosphate dehydrogenase [Gammaproteobacteria bacterium]|nr:glucose-6-phosphate dehydrogenase [Gammaproteobacteria bacterium]
MDQQDKLLAATETTQFIREPVNSCILVIFGIAGDLTKRLLFPAICNLGSAGLLAENFCIVGVAKESYTSESFRQQLIKDIDEFVTDPAAKQYGLALINRVFYLSGDFSDPTVYTQLKTMLEKLAVEKASKNYLFYFAVPPEFIETITVALSKTALLTEEENNYFRRIVVEKPFGHDLISAKKLNALLLSLVNEQQIFRIDHFLGKETVQNLLVFRFSNGLFEPIWSRLYIDHVQITVAEILGVELRGNYYERAGALRDMIPNHLFQMLSLITMEPPSAFSADYIRAEKEKVLRAVQIPTPEQVLSRAVRGQYGPGKIDNQTVVGYRAEPNVAPQSSTETYVALKLLIDNWRWLHVPFYLRTGKRMPIHQSEIIIQFRSGPSALFNGSASKVMPNLLHIFIQPEEGISLRFNAKIPGPDLQLGQVNMKFKYSDYFGIKPQTGYETILYDCMKGDQLLFNHANMVETEWALVQPILDVWGALPPRDFPNYAAGTWGPNEADELLLKDGRKWLL